MTEIHRPQDIIDLAAEKWNKKKLELDDKELVFLASRLLLNEVGDVFVDRSLKGRRRKELIQAIKNNPQVIFDQIIERFEENLRDGNVQKRTPEEVNKMFAILEKVEWNETKNELQDFRDDINSLMGEFEDVENDLNNFKAETELTSHQVFHTYNAYDEYAWLDADETKKQQKAFDRILKKADKRTQKGFLKRYFKDAVENTNEKKADRTVARYMNDINIEANLVDAFESFATKTPKQIRDLTQRDRENAWYTSDGKFDKSELRHLNKLCEDYAKVKRWRASRLEREQSENFMNLMYITKSWWNVIDAYMAEMLFDNIDEDHVAKCEWAHFFSKLFGDLNHDGVLVAKWWVDENGIPYGFDVVDKWTKMWNQIAEEFLAAKSQLMMIDWLDEKEAEKKMFKNIMDLLIETYAIDNWPLSLRKDILEKIRDGEYTACTFWSEFFRVLKDHDLQDVYIFMQNIFSTAGMHMKYMFQYGSSRWEAMIKKQEVALTCCDETFDALSPEIKKAFAEKAQECVDEMIAKAVEAWAITKPTEAEYVALVEDMIPGLLKAYDDVWRKKLAGRQAGAFVSGIEAHEWWGVAFSKEILKSIYFTWAIGYTRQWDLHSGELAYLWLFHAWKIYGKWSEQESYSNVWYVVWWWFNPFSSWIGAWAWLQYKQQTNFESFKKRLDSKSASFFDATFNVSLAGMWWSFWISKDRLVWIEQRQHQLQEFLLWNNNFPWIASLQDLEEVTIRSSLKKHFSDTNNTVLDNAAKNLATIYAPLKGKRSRLDQSVKENLAKELALRYALHTSNQEIDHLSKKLKLTWARVWLQFFGALMLPTFGLQFTKQLASQYRINESSYLDMQREFKEWNGAIAAAWELNAQRVDAMHEDINRVLSKEWKKLLAKDDISFYTSAEWDALKLSQRACAELWLWIYPMFKQYVVKDDTHVYIPAKIPLWYVRTMLDTSTGISLIAWGKGIAYDGYVAQPYTFDQIDDWNIGEALASLEELGDPVDKQKMLEHIDQQISSISLTDEISNAKKHAFEEIRHYVNSNNFAFSWDGTYTFDLTRWNDGTFSISNPPSHMASSDNTVTIEYITWYVTTQKVEQKSTIEWRQEFLLEQPSIRPAVKNLLENNQTFLDIRYNQRTNYKAFREVMHGEKQADGSIVIDYQVAADIANRFGLSVTFQWNDTQWIAELQKLDGALSADPKVKDKMNGIDEARVDELLWQITLNRSCPVKKSELRSMILGVLQDPSSYGTWTWREGGKKMHNIMWWIINGNYTNSNSIHRNSPEYELFWLVAPLDLLKDVRKKDLMRKLQENTPDIVSPEKVLNNFALTEKQSVYNAEETSGYAMMFGYPKYGNEIFEQFLRNPKTATALVDANKDTKAYYFAELLARNDAQLSAFLTAVNNALWSSDQISKDDLMKFLKTWETTHQWLKDLKIKNTVKVGHCDTCFNEFIIWNPEIPKEDDKDIITAKEIEKEHKVSWKTSLEWDPLCDWWLYYNTISPDNEAIWRQANVSLVWILWSIDEWIKTQPEVNGEIAEETTELYEGSVTAEPWSITYDWDTISYIDMNWDTQTLVLENGASIQIVESWGEVGTLYVAYDWWDNNWVIIDAYPMNPEHIIPVVPDVEPWATRLTLEQTNELNKAEATWYVANFRAWIVSTLAHMDAEHKTKLYTLSPKERIDYLSKYRKGKSLD